MVRRKLAEAKQTKQERAKIEQEELTREMAKNLVDKLK